MKLDNISKEVKMICRVCGNDEFSCRFEDGDLSQAPNDTVLQCSCCGFKTTKSELIEDNSEAIDAAVKDMVGDITDAFNNELKKSLKGLLK